MSGEKLGYGVEFGDGPLDGVRFELPAPAVSVTIVMEDRVLRYEADRTVAEDGKTEIWRLVQPFFIDEYDAEVEHDLQRNRQGRQD